MMEQLPIMLATIAVVAFATFNALCIVTGAR